MQAGATCFLRFLRIHDTARRQEYTFTNRKYILLMHGPLFELNLFEVPHATVVNDKKGYRVGRADKQNKQLQS